MGKHNLLVGVKYKGRALLRENTTRTDFCEECLAAIPVGTVRFRGGRVSLCPTCASEIGDHLLFQKAGKPPKRKGESA